MASLEKRGDRFRVVVRLQGVKYSRALDALSERAAQLALLKLEENLDRLKSRSLVPPAGADLLAFLLDEARLEDSGSQPVNHAVAPPVPDGPLTLAGLFAEYFSQLPVGNLEECTIRAMKIHERQLEKRFGKAFLIGGLTTTHLQSYIENRSRDEGRNGRKVSPVTIKKAIVTLRTLWNWGRQHDLITRPFPGRGLKYPKAVEKPRFMTYFEVSRRVEKLPLAEAADLWACAFLSLAEIEELLETVRQRARHPFIYPLFVFAAHTGARRSEMIRSLLTDLDFEANLVTIHERKKSHDKRTTRQVSMSPLLHKTMRNWLDEHPGGEQTFCHGVEVGRTRTTRLKPLPITPDEMHDHFRRTLAGTEWEKLHGWHVFRHSFCSNCAAKGIDQRIINAWVGHLSEEMVRRYRHLLPDQQQAAIAAVFGGMP